MKVWASEDNKMPASGERRFCETTDETRLGCLGQVAEFLQLFNPVRRIAVDHEGLVIDGGVSVRNLLRRRRLPSAIRIV